MKFLHKVGSKLEEEIAIANWWETFYVPWINFKRYPFLSSKWNRILEPTLGFKQRTSKFSTSPFSSATKRFKILTTNSLLVRFVQYNTPYHFPKRESSVIGGLNVFQVALKISATLTSSVLLVLVSKSLSTSSKSESPKSDSISSVSEAGGKTCRSCCWNSYDWLFTINFALGFTTSWLQNVLTHRKLLKLKCFAFWFFTNACFVSSFFFAVASLLLIYSCFLLSMSFSTASTFLAFIDPWTCVILLFFLDSFGLNFCTGIEPGISFSTMLF